MYINDIDWVLHFHASTLFYDYNRMRSIKNKNKNKNKNKTKQTKKQTSKQRNEQTKQNKQTKQTNSNTQVTAVDAIYGDIDVTVKWHIEVQIYRLVVCTNNPLRGLG